MIFKKKTILFFFFIFLSLFRLSTADEKFEGLVASVDSEAITTYDLSERIKLVLKSLKLEDNIKNRDSVRERVLELLIMEKLKKIEAKKAEINATKDEVIEFASIVYNFPLDDFEDFKSFLESEKIDFEIVLEQLKNELLWKKLSQQMFASKITINSIDVDVIIKKYENKLGKTEYDYREIILLNNNLNDWDTSKKKLETVLSLMETGTSFDLLASKFSDIEYNNNKNNNWTLEDNIDGDTRSILEQMKIGDIKKNIKINNGFKIIKLNNKRKFGKKDAKYTFIKFSSLEKEQIKEIFNLNISCKRIDEIKINEEIKHILIKDVIAKDLSQKFLNHLEITQVNDFTEIFEVGGENNLIFLCAKNESEIKPISRDMVERRVFSKKFSQLSNTFMSNIRKSANIKFFNK